MFERIDNKLKDIVFGNTINRLTDMELLHICTYVIARDVVITGDTEEEIFSEVRKRFEDALSKSIVHSNITERMNVCYLLAFLVRIRAISFCDDMIRYLINIIVFAMQFQYKPKTQFGMPHPYGLILSDLWGGKCTDVNYFVEEQIIRCLCNCEKQLRRHVLNTQRVNDLSLYYITKLSYWAHRNKIFPHKCEQIFDLMTSMYGYQFYNSIEDIIIEKIRSLYLKYKNRNNELDLLKLLSYSNKLAVVFDCDRFSIVGSQECNYIISNLLSKINEIPILTFIGLGYINYLYKRNIL